MGCLVLNANSSELVRSERSGVLRKNGFEVAEATTIAEALPIAIKLRPRIVLASVPIGSNVSEVWRRLRTCRQTQDIPLILTFATDDSDCSQNRELANVWIPEPVGPHALISVIRMFLRDYRVAASEAILKQAEAGERGETPESIRSRIGYALPEPPRAVQLPARLVGLETVHDLMSPLSTLTAISSWIVSEYGASLDETGREYLELLQKSIERMHKAVYALLDVRPA
jgi:DNA-binding response OmpR family regulator